MATNVHRRIGLRLYRSLKKHYHYEDSDRFSEFFFVTCAERIKLDMLTYRVVRRNLMRLGRMPTGLDLKNADVSEFARRIDYFDVAQQNHRPATDTDVPEESES